jgi:sugar phosphate isomerase/epimerase
MLKLRSDLVFTLPWAMICHLPFAEQVKTAKAVGFQELTLQPYFMADCTRAGLKLKDMKAMAEDAGLRIGRIDPLTTWVPDWRDRNFGDEYNLITAMDSTLFLELSAFFGCKYLSLNGMWKPGRYSLDQIAEYYRAICEKAAPYGIACDIEPIPMWGVRTLEDTLEIIRRAEVPNSGIVFDVTHFTRGGTPLKVLESTPGHLIHCVQLCDGVIPAKLSLEEECFSRLWPGEGDFKIAEIVRVLDRIGGLNGVGPEVFSPVFAKERTPGAWIAKKVDECLARYPQLLAGRGG